MKLHGMLEAAATGAAEVATGWGQGRATYGGLVAGMLVARAERLVDDPSRRLRVASITFAGPTEPGPVTIEGRVLRAGGSASTVQAAVRQGDDVRATLTASYGADRPTTATIDPRTSTAAPAITPASELQPIPHFAGLPDFLRHVELRFATGSAPFSGAAEAAFGGWMRFREAPERFGDRELLALTDAWPPGVAPLIAGPAPMSSLAWTFELVGGAPDGGDAPDAHWQYDVRPLPAEHGYASTTARVWDESGRLRAFSRQTIAYFDPREVSG